MMNVTIEFSFCSSCNNKRTVQDLRQEEAATAHGTFGSLYKPGKGSITVPRKEMAALKLAAKQSEPEQPFKIDELNF